MQDYLRPMVDFLALKFGILVAKRLFVGNCISINHAFMLVANKIGQKVKKFNLGFFFRKIQQMINKSDNKSSFKIFLDYFVFQCL